MDLSSANVFQVFIPVADLERAIAFYRDTLGVPFLFTAPPQMSFFQAGNVRLLVGVPQGPESGPARGGGTVYFGVKDIGAAHAELSRRGVRFGAEPHVIHRTDTYDLWLAEFNDPDGNSLALMSEVPRQA
jgi:methylmalonyl-CoA/ethylmalonyl-CoA epimerase